MRMGKDVHGMRATGRLRNAGDALAMATFLERMAPWEITFEAESPVGGSVKGENSCRPRFN